jgi:uncharacterized small protein (DUF1192 family)
LRSFPGKSLFVEVDTKLDMEQDQNEEANVLNIDRSSIPQLPLDHIATNAEALSNLNQLGVSAYDADEVERNVIEQVDKALKSQPQEEYERKVGLIQNEIETLQSQINDKDDKKKNEAILKKIKVLEKKLATIRENYHQREAVKKVISSANNADQIDYFGEALDKAMEEQVNRGKLISTGKITPFDKAKIHVATL